MDRLSPLFAHFTPSTRVFHSGTLCAQADFPTEPGLGHLHLLREGVIAIGHGGASASETRVSEPSVILYPRPTAHRFRPLEAQPPLLVCATLEFGAASANPVVEALPELLVVPMDACPELAPALELLFSEGLGSGCGRQAAVDALMQYFLVLLLRYLMNHGGIESGLLRALGEPRLARAITAMHARPGQPWSLESLAAEAGMSRARFAHHFREVVGQTPLDYLAHWRMSIARDLIRRGRPLKSIARTVGYESQATFTRAFTRLTGKPPGEWSRETAEVA